jgi:hypothetical protein
MFCRQSVLDQYPYYERASQPHITGYSGLHYGFSSERFPRLVGLAHDHRGTNAHEASLTSGYLHVIA